VTQTPWVIPSQDYQTTYLPTSLERFRAVWEMNNGFGVCGSGWKVENLKAFQFIIFAKAAA